MMTDLFLGLISSKTRVKLLIRFFLNPEAQSYMRQLSGEFNISSNAVREELNQLSKGKLLKALKNGRQIYYTANQDHPLFPELMSMVRKVTGIDQVIDGIVNRLGHVKFAYLMDDYAEGRDTGIIDLLLVGNIDMYHLNDLSRKTERYVNRKIRSLVMNEEEFEQFLPSLNQRPRLLIWKAENSDQKK